MKFNGLTDKEVEESRQKYGSNRLSEVESETFWDKLKDNFGDPMIKILCVALLINIVIFILSKMGLVEADVEWYEPIGIAIAITLATFVSTASEYRNENAFQKLQEEASKILCKVYRNGGVEEIPIDDVVTGDYIMLQSGDKIPADGILADGDIKVDQSVLNGEAKEAKKVTQPEGYTAPADEAMDFLNEYKVFRGTVVCSGNAVMKAETVGDKTVYGKIAGELQQDDDRESPLKVKLGGLADGISKFGYIGGVAIAVALLIHKIVLVGSFGAYFDMGVGNIITDLLDALILAVIIIVMAVPEGLPLMIAIVSALNMSKMLKDNVLVRKIAGIETAGSLNILFSDKTGTITKGQLEAVVFVDGKGGEYKTCSEVPGKLGEMLTACITENTTAMVNGTGKDAKVIGGNATERAVLAFAAGAPSCGMKKLASIPFNSDNKYSAATVEGKDFKGTLIKGAPEKLLSKCSYYLDESGNKQSFTGSAVDDKINELASRAIRVLALAISDDVIEAESDKLPEGEWTLVGVLGIRDEVRPESVTAIKEVQGAGVQVVMITGDRKDTAVAIAKEAGLLKDEKNDIVLTSDELAKLSDDEVKSKLKNIRVIARALPSDKSRLVRIAQELDLVAGMTGDGVNDSPALKKADVGFAMGGGTEVAKEASDIVIMDDNFNSIDKAILYGRTIFNSIRKFIIFQLTINVSAVAVSFICPLLGMDNPLSITQILWVNLVMDTLAALAFGGEPALPRYMKEKPKSRKEPIVNKYMWSEILTGAVWIFGLSLVMLLTGINTADDTFKTDGLMASFFRTDAAMSTHYLLTGYFCFFIFAAVFNAFNARTEKLNLFDNIGKNTGFLKILGIITVVQIIMTYLGGAVLDCYGLNAVEWITVLVMAFSIIPVDLIRKAIVNGLSKK